MERLIIHLIYNEFVSNLVTAMIYSVDVGMDCI